MSNFRHYLALAFGLGVAAAMPTNAVAQPYTFTATNIVVERMNGDANYGPGGAALGSTATAVFIDQFLPNVAAQAVPVNTAGITISIALPTTVGALAMTDSGSATSNGYFTRTVNGQGLVAPGYNAALATVGVASTNPATINRSIGFITASGVNSSNGFSDGPSNNFRSVASVDGSAFYASTAGTTTTAGILLKNATGSVTTTTPILNGNTRNLQIFNNSLFVSSSSATPGVGISLVGSAGSLPTAATTSTLLPGTGTSGTGTPSPYGFFLLDNPLNANNWNSTGLDTLYVADDRTGANGGGLQRWVYDGTTWLLTTTVATASGGARGLTATFDALTNTTSLWLTTTTASSNQLVAINDVLTATSGTFDAAFVTLATSPVNTVFRGVAIAPVPEPVSVLSICAAGGAVAGMWYRRKYNRKQENN